MDKIIEHLKNNYIKYIILFVISMASMVGIVYLRAQRFDLLVGYYDAFFILGAVHLGLGCLSLANYYGAFNGISFIGHYIANNISNLFRKEYQRGARYADYVEYKDEKRKNDKFNFIPYFFYGIIFIIIALIFMNII